jgi:hypothetical protein
MRNGLEIVQQKWTRFLSTAVPCKTVPQACFRLVGPNNDAMSLLLILLRLACRILWWAISLQNVRKSKFHCGRNTLDALQQFAAYYRSLFEFPVIGLTGSNGKTIVKEWLNFLLSPDFNVIRSLKVTIHSRCSLFLQSMKAQSWDFEVEFRQWMKWKAEAN